MEKSIFKKMKLKKIHSNQQQQNSKQQIVSMSVQEIQNSLINKINMSDSNERQNVNTSNNRQSFKSETRQFKNPDQILQNVSKGQYTYKYKNSNQNQIHKKQQQKIKQRQSFYSNSQSVNSKSNSVSSKQIPQLMLQNQQMKEEIQTLKKEKQLIIQKYEHALSLSRSIQSQVRQSNSIQKRSFQKISKKNQQFSFRRSIDQAEKESLMLNFQKKQFAQDLLQNDFQKQKQQRTVNFNQKLKNEKDSNNKKDKQQRLNQSLEATLPVSFSIPSTLASNQQKHGNKIYKSVQTRHQNQNGVQIEQDMLQSNKDHNMTFNQQKFKNKINGAAFSLDKRNNILISKSNKSRMNLNNSSQSLTKGTLQDRFYEYCKNQIVRVNAQNAKLNLKLGELQNKLTTIIKENQNMKFVNEHTTSENANLQNYLNQYKKKLQKMTAQFQSTIQQQKQSHSKQLARLEKQINQIKVEKDQIKVKFTQKENQITKLRAQLKQKELQYQNYQHLLQQKTYIQMELNDSIIRNKRLKQKYLKSTAIDHLWEVKQVQFAGIIEILQKSKINQ